MYRSYQKYLLVQEQETQAPEYGLTGGSASSQRTTGSSRRAGMSESRARAAEPAPTPSSRCCFLWWGVVARQVSSTPTPLTEPRLTKSLLIGLAFHEDLPFGESTFN